MSATLVRDTAKAKRTRAKILAAALRLFRKQGFDAVGMREIAAAAGLSPGAAYYYFGSKDELVLAFYEQLQEGHWGEVQTIRGAHRETRVRLEAFTGAMLSGLRPDRRFITVLIRNGVDPESSLSPFHENTKTLRDEALEQFKDLIADGDVKFTPGIAPHMPLLFWLLSMGFILFWSFDSSKNQSRTFGLIGVVYRILFQLLRLQTLPPVRRMMADIGDALAVLRA